MQDELKKWSATYPRAPKWRDGTFAGSPVAAFVRDDVPLAIRNALGERASSYKIYGSAGQSEWTHTPWIAVLDPRETDSVEEGLYVVYALSHGCERLYLTIMQGCTTLFRSSGLVEARAELSNRARIIRQRISTRQRRLSVVAMDLSAEGWRSELYEAGSVVGRAYDTAALPDDAELTADLFEALELYSLAIAHGSSLADDVIVSAAQNELAQPLTLEQAKAYRQHRAIERSPSHSAKVKRVHPAHCAACGVAPENFYGAFAQGMLDAHHLIPLASLRDGESVTFDARRDFAVLCPSCHRAIHRLDDVSDIEQLKVLIAAARKTEIA